MGAPFSNLRSKLDRAVAAYLIAQKVGTGTNVFPANRSGDIDLAEGPVIIVRSHSGTPEHPLGGIWRFRVEVSIHGSAAPQPTDTSDQTERLALDQMTAQAGDALGQSADDMQSYQATADGITAAAQASAVVANSNNADLVDFTLQFWGVAGLDGGNPRAQGAPMDTTVFKEFMDFEAVCCASNVS